MLCQLYLNKTHIYKIMIHKMYGIFLCANENIRLVNIYVHVDASSVIRNFRMHMILRKLTCFAFWT